MINDKESLIKNEVIQEYWDLLIKKVDALLPQLKGRNPHASVNGRYDNEKEDWWTNGFWPGILWLIFSYTGNVKYKEEAWEADENLEKLFISNSYFHELHHDVGFLFIPTAVAKYKLTGDRDSLRRALVAATYLCGRFNLVGHYIQAWNGEDRDGVSIIDTVMNVQLLYWATEVTGNPRFGHFANAHMNTILKHFIRSDGSVPHIVKFDPETGEVLERLAGTGYSSESSWSRGQAWALYGLALAARYTKNKYYLDAAEKIAGYIIERLPEDFIPYWDYTYPMLEGEPRDSSAATITASGLLELCQVAENGQKYRNVAENIMKSLAEKYTAWDDITQQGILLHGTRNRPKNISVDVSLIYGDFFFVEALLKLSGKTLTFW